MPGSKKKRPIIVCDASPLIFLAKLDQLGLIEQVTGRGAVVLRCVVDEVLSKRAMPLEAERLAEWLSAVEVVDYTGSLFPTDALSRSDQSSLAWAVENHVEWLLADERLLRRFAQERGIQVIGFCGLLLQAVSRNCMPPEGARTAIDTAIRDHGFRISVDLYQQIVDCLGRRTKDGERRTEDGERRTEDGERRAEG